VDQAQVRIVEKRGLRFAGICVICGKIVVNSAMIAKICAKTNNPYRAIGASFIKTSKRFARICAAATPMSCAGTGKRSAVTNGNSVVTGETRAAMNETCDRITEMFAKTGRICGKMFALGILPVRLADPAQVLTAVLTPRVLAEGLDEVLVERG